MNQEKYRICTHCVMDTSDPQISFDANGVCEFCNNFYNVILPNWHPDKENLKELLDISEKIRKSKHKSKYDCIIGLSGGVDSSYLCYIAKEVMGLNPLLYTIDTGWNLKIASDNIRKIANKLQLDLVEEKVEWEEMKDLQLAFLKSGVPYQDMPQDHAIFAGLYNYAVKNKIKYVLTGGNYSTECVKPPYEWTYINDLRFIKDVYRKYGNKKMKTFPTCGMLKNRIYYRHIKNMKVVKPLDYVEFNKEEVIRFLENTFGWQQYKNKHYENIFTRFYEGYYLPKKFGYDKRRCYFSSLILTGQMSRDEALKELENNPYDIELIEQDKEYIAKKMCISKEELDVLINNKNKTYRDFKNSSFFLKACIKIAILLGVEKRNFHV